jgi:regulator of replication initiation timing
MSRVDKLKDQLHECKSNYAEMREEAKEEADKNFKLRAENDRLENELEKVKKLSTNLVEKMNHIYENGQYKNAWILYNTHFGVYTDNGGETWDKEQEALEDYLDCLFCHTVHTTKELK